MIKLYTKTDILIRLKSKKHLKIYLPNHIKDSELVSIAGIPLIKGDYSFSNTRRVLRLSDNLKLKRNDRIHIILYKYL